MSRSGLLLFVKQTFTVTTKNNARLGETYCTYEKKKRTCETKKNSLHFFSATILYTVELKVQSACRVFTANIRKSSNTTGDDAGSG